MRNRYSLVYAWTVARIRAGSRSRGPDFPLLARVCAASGRLKLLDHDVRRLALDDALDLEHLMLGEHELAVGQRADLVERCHGELDLRDAVEPRALADEERLFLGEGLELGVEAAELLVHRPKQQARMLLRRALGAADKGYHRSCAKLRGDSAALTWRENAKWSTHPARCVQ